MATRLLPTLRCGWGSANALLCAIARRSALKMGALHRAPYIVTFRYFIDAERGANHA